MKEKTELYDMQDLKGEKDVCLEKKIMKKIVDILLEDGLITIEEDFELSELIGSKEEELWNEQ